MRLITASQAWTDAQHESNISISAVAIDSAASATIAKKSRERLHETIFAAIGDDKEERIMVARQRISLSETRRTPIGKSTHRAAHLMTIRKVLRAIGTLPFQVQHLGHYLYHPCLSMRHVMNAQQLISASVDFSGMSDAKLAKAECMVTVALQSYKAEVHGGQQWGPARVTEAMMEFYGVTIEPKHWNRDWLTLWGQLRAVIHEVDIQAQQPVWQVIHTEKDEEAA
ncbi:hypothetical protein QN386_22280 [Pseudomonas sp. CCI3.2]|uniref:hypothetical protein n=1 Tax=unclassified Pseudomonas TaxID=196821 RepID=UPI002B2268CB|nr:MULTISPECIES: hypothetical protein [unclassified Pseudomonas]MEB0078025.1 hypothetical protein [Pseudomonas sp. MH10out]MEB0104032.1 hypothetical protein [Pseudomonas sp. CCI3.2]